MNSNKKSFTRTDAIIFISTAIFAAFIVFVKLLTEILKPIARVLSIIITAVEEGSEAAEEVSNHFWIDSLVGWIIFIALVVFIVLQIVRNLTDVYPCKVTNKF